MPPEKPVSHLKIQNTVFKCSNIKDSESAFFFVLPRCVLPCMFTRNLPAENNCVYEGLISDFVIFMRSAIFLRNC